jgi:hypothetical protein
MPPPLPVVAPRESITAKLRAHGMASSTIRQVNTVLDELEARQ